MSNKATDLVHLTHDGNFQLETDATVMGFRIIDDSSSSSNADDSKTGDERQLKIELQLDMTTMHPQGGGQPSDIGIITPHSSSPHNGGASSLYSASIEKVTIDRSTGIVTHTGVISLAEKRDNVATNSTDDFFPPKSKVRVCVSPSNRRILSECHTAGHVVDAAMAKCQMLLPPTKGYHFMDGPYVEYKGSIDVKERESFLENLKVSYQELIEEDLPTLIRTLPAEEADALCNRLAQNFNMADYLPSPDGERKDPSDESTPGIRVVTIAGESCPCGGTHVKSTGELKERGWAIKGLRCKKGLVRVRYGPKE